MPVVEDDALGAVACRFGDLPVEPQEGKDDVSEMHAADG